MSFRILGALLRKEFKMMKSNPLIPRVIIIMPLMVMLILPLVANLDVRNVNVTVVDNDNSMLSHRIIADLSMPEELTVVAVTPSARQALDLVERGKADVMVDIPDGLERELKTIDIEANGVNSTKGLLGQRYVAESVMKTISGYAATQGRDIESTTGDANVVNLYNPTLNFKNYIVPALIVVMLIIICGFLPALNLVSEVENSTIEAINVTPVGKFTFVLSKLIPYWVVGIIVIAEGMLIGRFVYGLAPQGSVSAIFLASILFSLVMSGLGVAVANRSATILQCIFVMMAFIIIFQLMGGLFTPISSMPEWAQIITYAVPPRYYNEIMRAIYLKGTSMEELWLQFAMLSAMALLFCAAASLTYRKRA